MSIDVNATAVVAQGGQQVSLGSLLALSAGSEPTYLVVSGLDRLEYTAASNGQAGTLSGDGHSLGFSLLGADSTTFGIVYTYDAATGAYENATYGSLDTTILTASSDVHRQEALSFFTTNDGALAQTEAANPYALSQDPRFAYAGTVNVVTQPGITATPSQATPESICSVAQTFVGQAWNDSGCWVLACNIAAEAGASLPISATSVGTPGLNAGEWFVAYDGPAGQTGDWQAMVKAGDMVVFATSATSGHITTVVSGAGANAQLIDNITYVNANGSIANSAHDGSANDVIIAGPHAASQEFATAVTGSVVIYGLDTPTVTATGAASVIAGTTTAIGGVFTATDPEGKAVTAYQVYDTATQNSLVLDNTTHSAHSAGSALTVAATDLANLQLLAGPGLAADTLEVRAFNGTYWGDWQAISLTTQAPVVSAQTAAGLLNQTGAAPVSVQDTAANIATNLAALGTLASASKVTGISITSTGSGSPTLAVTAGQLTAGAAALAKVSGPYILSATASAVVANLATVQAAATAGQLASITFSDAGTPTLALTSAQIAANTAALAKIDSSFTLATTAAGVNANLATLETLAASGQLASVTLTNTGVPTLTLTAAQYAGDSALLAKIAGPYAVSVTATAAAATLVGTAPVNYFSAGTLGGNHLLQAGASVMGNDSLFGGIGADTLDGSTSALGHAVLVASSGANVLNGGLGYDTLYGGGHTVLNAGASNQKLFGGYTATAHDTLNAGAGNAEYLATSTGSNLLNAGSGIGDWLVGGAGADRLNGSTAATGSAVLIAGTGANILNGGLGSDTLVAGGHSLLTGGTGADQLLIGGFSANSHDTLIAGSGNDTLGVGAGANLLNAGTGQSTLFGGAGNDTLQGGGGNGVLVAGTGHNVLQAGSGSDTLYGGGASLLIGGDGTQGTSTLVAGFTALAHDTLVAGTGSNEILAVSLGNNQLYADPTGTGTNDVLWAGAGNDTLYGAGYDHATSGPVGTTTYMVGHGTTTVEGSAGNDNVFVQNGQGATIVDGGAGTNIVTFTGHSFADATITTNDQNVTTVAFAGSTQTATLTNVQALVFNDANTTHPIAA